MKLPRWLVIAMLTSSVLAVLAAAGWWWVTWPERTAAEFHELLGDGKYADLKRLFDWEPGPNHQDDKNRKTLSAAARSVQFEQYEPVPRTVGDILLGRHQFEWFWAKDRTGKDILRVERQHVDLRTEMKFGNKMLTYP